MPSSECPLDSVLRRQIQPSVDHSLSVSYFPPNPEYVPLEAVVKKMPDFAYQLFFADPAATKKIENNVTLPSIPRLGTGLTVSE